MRAGRSAGRGRNAKTKRAGRTWECPAGPFRTEARGELWCCRA
ncbi:hypothetical protein [Azospirillum palustre]